MKHRQETNHKTSGLGHTVLVLFVVMFCLGLVSDLKANELAVPAEYVRDIKLPGFGDSILRPNTVHYDSFHGEILVTDAGNNRILIFGKNGVFKFSFSLTGILTTPRDVTTDPNGFIYVLGSLPSGQVLHRFDFDGASIGSIPVPAVHDEVPVELRFLASDEEGSIYALDHRGRRVLVFGQDDKLARTIYVDNEVTIPAELLEDEARVRGAYAMGNMSCSGGKLYIPVSNVGSVNTYSTSGEYLGSVGRFGSKPGTLNFPVAVEVSPTGLILVLDRRRYCVVAYSPSGQFLGEFGGRGAAPGWFMGPSMLSILSADRVIVGQQFQSKIQVCTVPEFIRTKADLESHEQAEVVGENSPTQDTVHNALIDDQRRFSVNSRPIGSQGGEFPSSESTKVRDSHNVSLPEVSE